MEWNYLYSLGVRPIIMLKCFIDIYVRAGTLLYCVIIFILARLAHRYTLRWEFIKEKKKENKNSTNKVIKKKKKCYLFFLGRFLGREHVFFFFLDQ